MAVLCYTVSNSLVPWNLVPQIPTVLWLHRDPSLFFDDNAEVLGLKDHGAATYFQMVQEKKHV